MKLEKIKAVPKHLKPKAIEKAVEHFVNDSHAGQGVDKLGFFNQTIENIASIVLMETNDKAHFWMLSNEEGDVLAYALAHYSKDIDNSLCYWVTQAWVDKSLRRTPLVREMWEQLREEGKRNFCKHIVFPASRNPKAYLRFLGKNWHEYAVLLKEDI